MLFKKIKNIFNRITEPQTARDPVIISEKRRCVLIVGMHRSGTSAMSGVLKILGLFNRGKSGSSPDNPKGFYEWERAVDINARIFKTINSSWDDERPLSYGSDQQKKIRKFQKKIKRAIKKDFKGHKYFVIKDPRISIFLPLYMEILESMDIESLLIMMERDDEEICLSLKKRNGFSREKSNALCKKYKNSVYQNLSKCKHIIVPFDHLVADPINTTEKIIRELALPFNIDEEKKREILTFISPDLKHSNT